MRTDTAARVAMVTGAGRGIGQAIARRFCESGFATVINDIDAEAASETAHDLTAAGHKALAVAADVSSACAVAQLFETAETHLGPLRVLVNNAGVFHSAPLETFPEEEWDREFGVGAKAVFLCSREAVRRMSPRGGRIVNISSIAGFIARADQIAYCAAKAAAIHFTRCLAVEVAARGITVNCVCPGMTDSAMLRQTAAQRGIQLEDYLAMIPGQRLATPEDHARTVVWLASDEAAHINGQVISVDGAQSIYHPLTLKGRL